MAQNSEEVELRVNAEEIEDENVPLLQIDVNFNETESERIVVYAGQTPCTLAKDFCDRHGKQCPYSIPADLDEDTEEKLRELIELQLANLHE